MQRIKDVDKKLVLQVAFCMFLLVLSAYKVLESYDFWGAPGLSESDKTVVAESATQESQVHKTSPTRLIFPSINLGLDVEDSTVDSQTNTWPLSEDKAHYANFTAKFGDQTGTMVIYGHRTWPVLRNTEEMEIGDRMIVVDNEGKSWELELKAEQNVTPDQVGFIYEETNFRVVIFTCDGWNNQFRRLMFFEPVVS